MGYNRTDTCFMTETMAVGWRGHDIRRNTFGTNICVFGWSVRKARFSLDFNATQ